MNAIAVHAPKAGDPTTLSRRRALGAAALVLAVLSGCAGISNLSVEVASFGTWPEGRANGSYWIERLPSQQAVAPAATAQQLDIVEAAARQSMDAVGFKPAGDMGSADVVVQFGARVTVYDRSPWDDPLWWRWGPAYWRGPVYYGPGWGARGWYPRSWGWSRTAPPPEREVALLLRDRASGTPLYEARAQASGYISDAANFNAMFRAALSDFPRSNSAPHTVRIMLESMPGPR